MARARFTPRPGAVEDLARSPQMAALLGNIADNAANEADRRLPFPSILGGVTVTSSVVQGANGWEGRVEINGPGWHLWEFGTRNHAPRPAIRPGVQAAISRAGGRWRAM